MRNPKPAVPHATAAGPGAVLTRSPPAAYASAVRSPLIGITFDLRDDYRRRGFSDEETAEFDSPTTIEAIDSTLKGLGYRTERIGSIRDLTARLASGERWDLVFNIAEGVRGFGRESQVPALLDAYDIPYTFSDPMVLALSLHKGMAKHVLRDLAVPTPDFAVVDDAADFAAVDLPFPLFAKPVAAGSSVGVTLASKVSNRDELKRRGAALLARFDQPVIVETFLPGREVTVGVVGTGHQARVLGVMEVLLQPGADHQGYTFDNKAQYKDRVRYALVEDELGAEARDLALRVWRGLGGRDAGRVDLRADAAGHLNFLEVNPLAGLHPVDSDLVIQCRLLGLPYQCLIGMIVESAATRVSGRLRHTVPAAAARPAGAA